MSELIGYLSEVEHLEGELTIPKQLGGSTLGTKTITENDTYYAEDDGLDGYSEVTVNVPTGGDTPVIESLSVTPTTSQQTYNDSEVDGYKPVVVNPIPPEYIVPTGTKNITQNGQGIDVAAFASANVNVPNSYSSSDEGKVVDNGALVAQTSQIITAPGTYDTTLINSIEVNIDMWTEQTISTSGAVTQALSPFVIYHFTGALTSLTITLTAPTSGLAVYHFDFDSGSTAPTLTLPNTITTPDSFEVDASKHYEVDILNNFATAQSWAI